MSYDFEYRKLRGKIIEIFGTYGSFADTLNQSAVTVSNKLNGKTQFSQDDIVSWCDALSIPFSEAGTYFFS